MATRMAGSDEFKKELDRAAGNKRIREQIAASPERTAERLSGLDRDAYDFSGFSDKDIVMAFQGDSFGDKDYERLTGKSLSSPESTGSTDPVTTPESSTGGSETVVSPQPGIEIGNDYSETIGDQIGGNFRPNRPSQNIGKIGDMTTTIGDGNTFGAGVSIGNDYSRTEGSQNIFGAALDLRRQERAREGAFGRSLQLS